SSALQVRKEACWLFGARHARCPPALIETAVWFSRLLGMLMKTYGIGGIPPPPMPPVAQDSDCQAVIVPSFLAAVLILANPEGRFPPICSSVARSRNSFTGRPPLAFERCAHATPQLSDANLLPNPPPM